MYLAVRLCVLSKILANQHFLAVMLVTFVSS